MLFDFVVGVVLVVVGINLIVFIYLDFLLFVWIVYELIIVCC